MHRRLVITVLAAALVTGACATRSDRSTAPVELPATLPTTAVTAPAESSCRLTVGDGRGAEVTGTVPDSSGEEAFVPGDVIVEFDGDAISSAADLVRAVGARRIGQTVDVVLASGEARALTLRENPDAEGRAQLGVLVATVEETTPLGLIATGDLDGDLVRVMQMDERLWLFDPVSTTWRSLGVEAPPTLWISLGGEVYSLSIDLDQGGARITSVIEDTSQTVDLGPWQMEGLFTTLNDVLLVGISQGDEEGPRTHAITAIDPVTGTRRWAWGMPDDGDLRTTPSFGFRSPTGSMTLIALTLENDLTQLRYIILREIDGSPEAVLGDFPEGLIAIGWHDATHIAGVIPPSIEELTIVDVTDGTVTTAPFGLSAVPIGLWPVGDGAHVVIEDGENLQVLEVGGDGRRLLSRDCSEGLLGEPGW
ncbi:MAG TPA: PDZ domain-containing protein [Acidimicrobiia bacterium]|nr:PDZ domain-containing protein [Acidimicrobiia bacterium]